MIPHPYHLFQFSKNGVVSESCYISKYATVADLEKKIARVLNIYLYFKKKNKDFTANEMNILVKKDPQNPFVAMNDSIDQMSKRVKSLDLKEDDTLFIDLNNNYIKSLL